jgi:hypothetical protein
MPEDNLHATIVGNFDYPTRVVLLNGAMRLCWVVPLKGSMELLVPVTGEWAVGPKDSAAANSPRPPRGADKAGDVLAGLHLQAEFMNKLRGGPQPAEQHGETAAQQEAPAASPATAAPPEPATEDLEGLVREFQVANDAYSRTAFCTHPDEIVDAAGRVRRSRSALLSKQLPARSE